MAKPALIVAVALVASLAPAAYADSDVIHSAKVLDQLISESSFSNALVVKFYSSR